jgi:hypothetical protein
MKQFVIYENTTGAICRVINAPDSLHVAVQFEIVAGTHHSFIEAYGCDDTHYVNLDGEPKIMPKEDYTLEALPLPCTVTIEEVEYLCTEQPTFEFNYPGTYTVSVDAGPRYLVKEFQVVWE